MRGHERALTIAGLGPFIAAGPIMGASARLRVGAAAGGLIGALACMGIPEYEAKWSYTLQLRREI